MEVRESHPVQWREAIEEWEKSARTRRFSEDTIRRTPKYLDFLIERTGAATLDLLTRRMMREFLDELSERGQKGKPISAKSLNNYICTYKSFFEWCKSAEIAPAYWKNPCEGIVLAKIQDSDGRCFTEDEVVAVYNAAVKDERSDKPRAKSSDGVAKQRSGLYWLMACTGLRIGIAEKIRVRNLCLDVPEPYIYKPAMGSGKERAARKIEISRHDANLLRDFLARHPRCLSDEDIPFERPHNRVFYGDCEEADIALVDHAGRWPGFHSFRRFHVTRLCEMFDDPSVVQQRLNHKNLETTLKVYNKVKRKRHVQAANMIGDSLHQKMCGVPLTGQGLIADTDNGSSQQAKHITETHARSSGVESGPANFHSLPGSVAPTGGLPRSGETVSGIQDVEVEDRGLEPLSGNGQHSRPEDGLLVEAAVTLARILDRLTDDRR